jgi:hypothetical protein
MTTKEKAEFLSNKLDEINKHINDELTKIGGLPQECKFFLVSDIQPINLSISAEVGVFFKW